MPGSSGHGHRHPAGGAKPSVPTVQPGGRFDHAQIRRHRTWIGDLPRIGGIDGRTYWIGKCRRQRLCIPLHHLAGKTASRRGVKACPRSCHPQKIPRAGRHQRSRRAPLAGTANEGSKNAKRRSGRPGVHACHAARCRQSEFSLRRSPPPPRGSCGLGKSN